MSNAPQTRKVFELEYNFPKTENLIKYCKLGYLESTGSAPSGGICNKLSDPANDDNININLNLSYSASQDG